MTELDQSNTPSVACYHHDINARENVTESYFVSCTARAEISVPLSVSDVGNVDVADYNIITPNSYCLAG